MKICTKCGVEKPLTEFHADKRATDGRTVWCKTCRNARTKEWQQENKDHVAGVKADWQKKNADKCRDMAKRDYAKNKQRYLANNAKRRGQIDSATFGDCSYVYHAAEVVASVYGGKPHVDHVVPLNGELVSGLHAPWNLQLLSASDNLSKGNSWQI
jgi:5-methylcytosine-specific restriction endonuclease McrA